VSDPRLSGGDGAGSLPWRGPGPGRPDLPLPPGGMPLRRGRAWRKRWRYVGVFGEQLLACAARVEVGPLGQTFWALWDRAGDRMLERTRPRLPGRRGEVWTEELGRGGLAPTGPRGAPAAPGSPALDRGSVVRIDGRHPQAGRVRAAFRFGPGRWVEVVCPAEHNGYVWTRKRVGVPVEAAVLAGQEAWGFEARGVEDESAGYHPRHTVWSWSAGVGRTTDQRAVGWNLVSGVNDPPVNSERGIWLDDETFEPGPVEFEGLDAVSFDDGSRLVFEAESERSRRENLLFVRYSYRQPFGRFAGSLPGGLELESGLGVIEHHDALW
jgi:hypothetical protein